jgi:flavin-dependent dehydrogenase
MRSSTERRRSTDVLIVGGGPSGAAAAMACASRGFRAVILEAQTLSRNRIGESLSALAHTSLAELGLLSEFLAARHEPTHLFRSVWGSEVMERDSLRHGWYPDHHLDRARFDDWLLSQAEQRGVHVLRPAARLQLTRDSKDRFVCRARIAGEPFELHGRAVIDATGRRAFGMKRLGARRATTDKLVGLARWYPRRANRAMVLVEAASEGWWYSAPTPDQGQVAIFFTDASSYTQSSRREALWQQSLCDAPLTRDVLKKLTPGRIDLHPASPQLTDWTPDGPYIPVGDAAFASDPISGSGLMFALSSGIEAARAIDLYWKGSKTVMAAYRHGVRRLFERHLAERVQTYAARRTLDAGDFWQRRRDLRSDLGARDRNAARADEQPIAELLTVRTSLP